MDGEGRETGGTGCEDCIIDNRALLSISMIACMDD